MKRTVLLLFAASMLGALGWWIATDQSVLPQSVEPVVEAAVSRQNTPADENAPPESTGQATREQHGENRVVPRPPFESPEFLQRFGGIRGRLVDEKGEPLGGLHIHATTFAPGTMIEPGDTTRPWWQGETRSTSDGAFHVPGLWKADGNLRLDVGFDSPWIFDESLHSLPTWRPVPGEAFDLGDVVLTHGSGLAGPHPRPAGETHRRGCHPCFTCVAAREGRKRRRAARLKEYRTEIEQNPHSPAAGITCEIENGELRVAFDPSETVVATPTVSDAEGRYRVSRVYPGIHSLEVEADEGRFCFRTAVGVGIGETKQVPDIIIPDGAPIEVTATSQDGTPIAGAVICAVSCAEDEFRMLGPVFPPSDKNGHTAVAGFTGKRFALAARTPDSTRWQLFGPFPAGKAAHIKLARTGLVTVKVIDQEGEKASQFDFRVVTDEPWAFGFHDYSHMVVPEELRDDQVRLAPGLYWFVADAGPDGMAWQRHQVVEGDNEATLTLGEQEPVTVEVVDSKGKPVFGARVQMNVYREKSWYERQQIGWTDTNGRRSLPGPRLRVFVRVRDEHRLHIRGESLRAGHAIHSPHAAPSHPAHCPDHRFKRGRVQGPRAGQCSSSARASNGLSTSTMVEAPSRSSPTLTN